MKHLKALGIKFIVLTVITFSIFAIFNTVSLIQLLLISFIVSGVTFLIGDLLLLPRIGNALSVIADFGLAALLFLGLGSVVVGVSMSVLLASLAASFFFAISESIFHIYMREQVYGIKRIARMPAELQTEFSEELSEQPIGEESQADKEKT